MQDITVELQIRLEADSTEIVHLVKYQVIRDLEKQEDSLFSDAVPMLYLVRVQSGDSIAIHSCLQLAENGLLESYIDRTRAGHALKIETMDGFPLYSARAINDTKFDFSSSADFHASPIHAKGKMKGARALLDIYLRQGTMFIHGHIGRGIGGGGFRVSGVDQYGSTDGIEDFKIETPDPEVSKHEPEHLQDLRAMITSARVVKRPI
jgi:hypothetical protein